MPLLPISQQGSAITYIRYDGLYHSVKDRYIIIYNSLLVVQPGIPAIENEQKPFRVDNSTAIPVLDANMVPVMVTVQEPTGQYEMITPPPYMDANNQPIQPPSYPDYNQPLIASVQKPATIGEYDKLYWEQFDARNPGPADAIEEIVLGGMRRRMGISSDPYVFVQTAAWLALQP